MLGVIRFQETRISNKKDAVARANELSRMCWYGIFSDSMVGMHNLEGGKIECEPIRDRQRQKNTGSSRQLCSCKASS